MKYNRVIPRDLFNEAKLLKCIGQLTLIMHDGQAPFIKFDVEDDSHFEIDLTIDGSLYIKNILFTVKGIAVRFKTTYNSKAPYPLFCEYEDYEYEVFDDDGDFTTEFLSFVKTLKV